MSTILATEVKAVFGMIKIRDYTDLLKSWKKLSANDFMEEEHQILSRHKFVLKAVALCSEKKITLDDLHTLDLIRVRKYSKTKMWKVHTLEKIAGTEYYIEDPATFKQKLQEQLDLFYSAQVCVHLQDQVYWIRIALNDTTSSKRKPPKIHPAIYIVHHPRTPYLFVNNLPVSLYNDVMWSLVQVLNCQDINQLNLRGHHLDSLMQLALNRYSQGAYSSYRLQGDENPLEKKDTGRKSGAKKITKRQKYKAKTLSDSDERSSGEESDKEEINLIRDDEEQIQKRKKLVSDTFGDNPQPILEKLEYTLETKFRGSGLIPGMQNDQELFRCRVKFEGPNVLEGLKELGNHGLVAMPMKDHLSKVPSMGMNAIHLTSKNANTTRQ